MKNKIISLFIMIATILCVVNVKANEWYEAVSLIEKGESSAEIYNEMATEINPGDIISVKAVVKNISGLRIYNGNSVISWDKNAFELVETNGKYYESVNSHLDSYDFIVSGNNYAIFSYSWDTFNSESNRQEIVTFKFRVKNDVKDGIYQIIGNTKEEAYLSLMVNGDHREGTVQKTTLKYQVGKTKVVSDYSKDSIGNGSYIIGNHLFTRAGSDEYDGVLTTEYIMLASKSIASNNKDDMIIYVKNARGNWFNAISNDEITPPDEFKIEYIDMKANYLESGIYSDNNNEYLLRVVQINDTDAAVLIETPQERVKGMGKIANKVINLDVSGKKYKITLSNNSAAIETSDTAVGNKTLQKKANYSVNDYYDNHYWSPSGAIGEARFYLKSEQSGKYTYQNNEIYVNRIADHIALICMKSKSSDMCEYSTYAESEVDNSTFMFSIGATDYTMTWSSNQLFVTSNDDDSYAGIYTKTNALTMKDVFNLWEENYVEYKVTFNMNTGDADDNFHFWALAGEPFDDLRYFENVSNPYRKGYNFIKWQLNGADINENTMITAPITVDAVWEIGLMTPVLTVTENDYYNKSFSINSNDYQQNDDIEVEGYELYYVRPNNQYERFATRNNLSAYNYAFNPATNEQIVARVFITDNEDKVYSGYSNPVTINVPELLRPTLSLIPGEGHEYTSYENGEYLYRFTINMEAYRYSDQYIIEGFHLHEDNGSDNPVVAASEDGIATIRLPLNTSKSYYATVYTRINGSYYYSSLKSASVSIGATIETPVISFANSQNNHKYVRFENGEFRYEISIANSYETVDTTQDSYINGVDLFEKVGNNYNPLLLSTQYNNPLVLHVTQGEEKHIYARAYRNDEHAEKVYSDFSNELVIDAEIATPTLSCTPMSSYSNGYYHYNCSLNQANYLISGDEYLPYKYNIYIKDGNNYTKYDQSIVPEIASETPLTEFGLGEVVDVIVAAGETKNIVAKVYNDLGNNEIISSDYSNIVTLNSTITTPTFTCSTLDSFSNGYYYYNCSINLNDYILSGEAPNYEYLPFKYSIYEKNGSNYTIYDERTNPRITGANPITEFDIDHVVPIVVEAGTAKTFVAKVFADFGQEQVASSEYSNEITINWTIYVAPEISIRNISNNSGTRRNQLLKYTGANGYEVELTGDIMHYTASKTVEDYIEFFYTIDGFKYFSKVGENLTPVYDADCVEIAKVYVPEGQSKSFVAEVYVSDSSNNKIYSPESNEITIDLTNPTYSFETIDVDNNPDKVYVKAYINDYELEIHGVTINGTDYNNIDTNRLVMVDKSVIENVNSITIAVAEDGTKPETATRTD